MKNNLSGPHPNSVKHSNPTKKTKGLELPINSLLPHSNKTFGDNKKNRKITDFAKEITEDCFFDKLSLYQTTETVNRFCKSSYSMKQVGKYMRRLRNLEAKNKLSPTQKKRTTNLPYVTNYLPLQKNELKKIPKEKTHNNQELVKTSGVFS